MGSTQHTEIYWKSFKNHSVEVGRKGDFTAESWQAPESGDFQLRPSSITLIPHTLDMALDLGVLLLNHIVPSNHERNIRAIPIARCSVNTWLELLRMAKVMGNLESLRNSQSQEGSKETSKQACVTWRSQPGKWHQAKPAKTQMDCGDNNHMPILTHEWRGPSNMRY